MASPYPPCNVIVVDDKFSTHGRDSLGYFKKKTIAKQEEQYVAAMFGALDTIGQTNLGKRLFASLKKWGMPVALSFPDPTEAVRHRKQCSSSATTRSHAASKYRKPYGLTHLEMQAAFRKIVETSGASYRSVATFLNIYGAYAKHWKNVEADELKELIQSDPNAIADRVQRNQKYGVLSDYPLREYLRLALESHTEHGDGDASTIRFDPWNTLAGADERPPHVGLFHELVHAWHNASGRRMFDDDSVENEYMTIGIPPFDRRNTGNPRVYTENRYRGEIGMKPRLSIG